MVGAEGFEPPTLCSQSRCATRLRYAPKPLLIVTRNLDSVLGCGAMRALRGAAATQSSHSTSTTGKAKIAAMIAPSSARNTSRARCGGAARPGGGRANDSCAGWLSTAMSKISPKSGIVPTSTPMPRLAAMRDERNIGHAANPRGQRNDKREQPGQHIAQPGNEADDSVEAEANACAGNAKRLVEQNLEFAQRLVAKEPRATIPAASRCGAGRRRDGRGSRIWFALRQFCSSLTGLQTICFDATIDRVNGGYSSAAERLTVAQDVVGSIPTSRPTLESIAYRKTPPSGVQSRAISVLMVLNFEGKIIAPQL